MNNSTKTDNDVQKEQGWISFTSSQQAMNTRATLISTGQLILASKCIFNQERDYIRNYQVHSQIHHSSYRLPNTLLFNLKDHSVVHNLAYMRIKPDLNICIPMKNSIPQQHQKFECSRLESCDIQLERRTLESLDDVRHPRHIWSVSLTQSSRHNISSSKSIPGRLLPQNWKCYRIHKSQESNQRNIIDDNIYIVVIKDE